MRQPGDRFASYDYDRRCWMAYEVSTTGALTVLEMSHNQGFASRSSLSKALFRHGLWLNANNSITELADDFEAEQDNGK